MTFDVPRFDLPDIVGLAGSLLFIATFIYANAAKQLDKILFNALNLIGAGLLLYSLWHKFNLAAFMLEAAWAAIGAWGLVTALLDRGRAETDRAQGEREQR